MAKAKKRASKTNWTRNVLIIIVAAIVVATGALLLMMRDKGQDVAYTVHTSLGPIEYRIEDNKAVKRTDSAATELRTFLERQGERSGCNADTYYRITAASNDEQQVLLEYGCDAPTARKFAVQRDGEWQAISPTNQFDVLGTPRCEHVDEHNIDTSIAPVCVNGHGEGPLDEHEYVAR